MNRDGPLGSKKARRVPPPLPHPFWRHGDANPSPRPGRSLSPEEFWARLGL